MAKLSLKVVVAGRTYPLSVEESEEKRVLKSASDINKAIKLLQDNYAVKDMQDLLAMTALQLASKSDNVTKSEDVDNSKLKEIEDDLQALSDELDD
jgi:cell division protein ZapA